MLLSRPATLWFYVKVLLRPARSHAFAHQSLVDSVSLHGVAWPAMEAFGAAAIVAGVSVSAWKKKRAAHSQTAMLSALNVHFCPADCSWFFQSRPRCT